MAGTDTTGNRRYKRPIEINSIYVTVTIFTKEGKKRSRNTLERRTIFSKRAAVIWKTQSTNSGLSVNKYVWFCEARRLVRRATPRFLPGQPSGRITSLISFFNSRTLKNKRVAFGAGWSRARSIKAPALWRETRIPGLETSVLTTPTPPLSPCAPPPRCRSPPSVPGHGSQNLFSSADRCNFALSWQRRVHRSSDVSRPPPLHTLSLQSAVNCFQLNCLPFSRHPFAAQHRLFAPLNAARTAFETHRIFDARCRDIERWRRGERGDGKGRKGAPTRALARCNDPIIDIAIRYRIVEMHSFRRLYANYL